MSMEIGANVISGDLRQAGGGFWIDPATVTSIAERYRALLRIKTPDTHQQVLNLSGGNQQKVVMAKWLSLSPAVFIVDEPTHGVDVGAKMEIYEILKDLTSQGVAILLISSELPEILALSDRVVVMCNQTVAAEFSRAEATEELILKYASGFEDHVRLKAML